MAEKTAQVVPAKVAPDTAATRFRAHMTSGLMTPPGLAEATWSEPRLVLVPACEVKAKVISNWTAESGTRSGNKSVWTPMSGQHQETHSGIRFLASKPWMRNAKVLLPALDESERTVLIPDGAEVAESIPVEGMKARATDRVRAAEQEACAAMVPGIKRRLQVNSTIEKMHVQSVLIPVYEVEVEFAGRTHGGWVDGTTGRVHAAKITSYTRVGAAVGALLGMCALIAVGLFVVSALSGQALLAAAEAERVELEQRQAEELAALEQEWADSQEALVGAVAAGERALEDRDAPAARTAVEGVAGTIDRLIARVEDEALTALSERYRSLEQELEHLEAVTRGIRAANEVASDGSSCTTPVDIEAAWKDLRRVRSGDPEWQAASSAVRGLERCRAKSERELTEGLKQVMRDQREATRARIERSFLDDGRDVRVRVSGTNKDRLTMTWVLFGRAAVHQMTDGGSMREGSLLRNLQDGGFRRVTFSDGYDKSIFYDLEPPSEDGAGKEVLKEFGLSEPLKLPYQG